MEVDAEPEIKRRNTKETCLDTDDPELIAAEILFKKAKADSDNRDGEDDIRPSKKLSIYLTLKSLHIVFVYSESFLAIKSCAY